MKRQKARLKKKEEERVLDRVFNLLLILEASDFNPVVKDFCFTNNIADAMSADPEHDHGLLTANAVPPPGGVIGGGEEYGVTAVSIVQCEQVPKMKYAALRTLWSPLVNEGFPDVLCKTRSTVVRENSGRVVHHRSDYRFRRTPTSRRWLRFPAPWMTNGAQKYRITATGHWSTETESAASTTGAESRCAIAPVLLTACGSLQSSFWSVAFTCQRNGTRLRLFTSQEGVTGFFQLRDVSESGRRKALRHWVREHTRKLKPAGKTDVIAHLRGQEAFGWFGFEGRVFAPTNLLDEPAT